MQEKTIRWGIIGCGQVTEQKSGPGFQKAHNSSLQAVMRRNRVLAEDFAKRHNVPRYYDDSQALINDPQVDAVYIATPPHLHLPYVAAVAAAGKPVYVEKPMALNFEQCQKMNQVCRQAQIPVWVAYYRRALPKFNKIKEIIDTGGIGQVRSVQVTFCRPYTGNSQQPLPWRLQPEISGGGFYMDLACHTFDYLDYLFGPVIKVNGSASNQSKKYAAEDTVSGFFEFESGLLGSCIWSFDSYEKLDRTEISGTAGKLIFSSFGYEAIEWHYDDHCHKISTHQPEHVQQPLIQAIVDELNGNAVCPSTGESAERTAGVMQAMLGNYAWDGYD